MTTGLAYPTRFLAAPAVYAQKQLRLRDWCTFSAVVSFVAGLLTNLRFQFGGRVSVGELVLAAIALFAVFANMSKPRFWNRRMVLILAALCVSLCGYVISDLVNATPPDRMIRGWARMAFVMGDFIAIWALARNSIVNLFSLCVGDAFSTALSYGQETRDFLYNYKFHLAIPITVLILVVIPVLLRRRAYMATSIGLIGAGMFHLRLDDRLAGATCILIGFILMARCITASHFRSLYLTLLALALVLSSTSIGYLYKATNVSFADRREGSNSARLSMAMAGVSAIERSPIFGLGSWVWDTEMRNVYAGKMGRGSTADWDGGETMGPHSQILQAWAEAGLLGLVFFVYYAGLLMQALWLVMLRRNLDLMAPLFLYYLLTGLWDVLFSPFANLHRFWIGLALVISIQVLREHKSPIRLGKHRIVMYAVPVFDAASGPFPPPLPRMISPEF